ncbi:MAG: hypothetical protein AAF824_01270 [Bacteroidota bacterium]
MLTVFLYDAASPEKMQLFWENMLIVQHKLATAALSFIKTMFEIDIAR